MTLLPDHSDIQLTRSDAGVLTAVLNRPDKLNALSPDMREGVKEALRLLRDDDGNRCLVLTGEGRGFCSGADVGSDASSYSQPQGRRSYMESKYGWMHMFWECDKPVIAAVNGVAAGAGMSLALACDVRIASRDARFISAFVRRGLIPDNGATVLLPRTIGISRALRMMWTGDAVGAEEALQIGLVDEVVDEGDSLRAAQDLAERLAKGPSVAIELTKRSVYAGLSNDVASQLRLEEYWQGFARASDDYKEGIASYREKRPPNFKGS